MERNEISSVSLESEAQPIKLMNISGVPLTGGQESSQESKSSDLYPQKF